VCVCVSAGSLLKLLYVSQLAIRFVWLPFLALSQPCVGMHDFVDTQQGWHRVLISQRARQRTFEAERKDFNLIKGSKLLLNSSGFESQEKSPQSLMT
jgi:hypothetical protein